jgi:hypothetical protein
MMNVLYKTKSKSELRAESEKLMKKFLKAGGSIEIVKSRKAPKQKMTCKNSRGFVSGTSGFAAGYPTKTL